jgi:hypothetical protein
MSVGASGPHLGGDPNCFHELLSRCTLAQRCLGVPLDAVWALCDVRDGYGDDLLGLRGQRAVGEDSLAEGIECCFDVGSEGSSFLRKLRGRRRVEQNLACFPPVVWCFRLLK